MSIGFYDLTKQSFLIIFSLDVWNYFFFEGFFERDYSMGISVVV
jgi:hypothetical protein